MPSSPILDAAIRAMMQQAGCREPCEDSCDCKLDALAILRAALPPEPSAETIAAMMVADGERVVAGIHTFDGMCEAYRELRAQILGEGE